MTSTIMEVARAVGCSDAAIHRARHQGRLPEHIFTVNEQGKTCMIDLEDAAKVVASIIGVRSAGNMNGKGKGKTPPPPPPRTQDDDDAEDRALRAAGIVDKYQDARATREFYTAQKAELEYKQRAGQLVDKTELATALFGVGRTFRDSLQQLRPRLAALLASERDEHRIDQILQAEFNAMLEEAADALQRLAAGG
jgi:hypothetical protein